ncbi:MAG: DegV family protein [Bacilli bacterium]|nr:DegV family protein [Bacilli bacterium]
MKIIISTESTCDLPKEILEKNGISTIPYTVLLGERSGADGVITPDDIFKYVDETKDLPRTCAVNEYDFTEYFSNLRKNCDVVIHITLSSKITSSVENARNAAKLIKGVYIVNSKSLSTGIALLALYGKHLVDKGYEPEEIVKKLEARRNAVQASFVINTLNYLHKGGRCSGLAHITAAILRIKPQIIVKNGELVTGKKYFGKNAGVITSYCKDVLNEFDNPDKSLVFITHSQASPEMVEAARKELQERGFKNIVETLAGATISSHCGPKTLGILYFNDGGVKD